MKKWKKRSPRRKSDSGKRTKESKGSGRHDYAGDASRRGGDSGRERGAVEAEKRSRRRHQGGHLRVHERDPEREQGFSPERKHSDEPTERSLLFGAVFGETRTRARGGSDDDLGELRRLAETAGVRVVESVVQRRPRPVSATYVGKGFAERIGRLVEERGLDSVICDSELSPGQMRNLERITDTKVVDRTELILDIFAHHAKTRQAKLQVELAQLEYALPRLRRMWTHLERIQGGIGFRGPGEKQLELDRRLIRDRIADLKRALAGIRSRREREVDARVDEFTVALVGYTNAGKSTLMNALTGADAYVADRLFATLDTRTRPWFVTPRRMVLLSDTVGFIGHLPHHLVESFHATLEEVKRADLLLHVVDVSQDDPLAQAESVRKTLQQLECEARPTVTVLNKTDLLPVRGSVNFFAKRLPNPVTVSALTGEGLELLGERVLEHLCRNDVHREVRLDVREGKAIASLEAWGKVLWRRVEDETLVLAIRIPERALWRAFRLAMPERVEVLPLDSLPRPDAREKDA